MLLSIGRSTVSTGQQWFVAQASRLLFCLIFGLTAWTLTSNAQVVPFDESHRETRLRVEAFDPQGKALDRYSVEVVSEDGRVKREGNEHILPVGRYRVHVSTPWDRHTQTVNLIPGQNLVIVSMPWVSVVPVEWVDVEIVFETVKTNCRRALISALFHENAETSQHAMLIGSHNRILTKLAPATTYVVVLLSQSGVCDVGYVEVPNMSATVPFKAGLRKR